MSGLPFSPQTLRSTYEGYKEQKQMDKSQTDGLAALKATLKTLRTVFMPYEINPTVRPIVTLIQRADAQVNELGESLSNGDDGGSEKLKEATAQVFLLLKQLEAKDEQLRSRDVEIVDLRAKLKRLEDQLKPLDG